MITQRKALTIMGSITKDIFLHSEWTDEGDIVNEVQRKMKEMNFPEIDSVYIYDVIYHLK